MLCNSWFATVHDISCVISEKKIYLFLVETKYSICRLKNELFAFFFYLFNLQILTQLLPYL